MQAITLGGNRLYLLNHLPGLHMSNELVKATAHFLLFIQIADERSVIRDSSRKAEPFL